MTETKHVRQMITESTEAFVNELDKGKTVQDAFNNATQGYVTEICLLRTALNQARLDAERVERAHGESTKFAAKLIADSILDLLRTKDALASATKRAESNGRSRLKLARIVARLFLESHFRTVSEESLIARVEHLLCCELALLRLVEHIDSGGGYRSALDSARKLVQRRQPTE